ncbi:SDR family NAD(P)-dependent oxidoreductase [Microbacterium rhizophilus]|uniref:SDR family NAD(P)-dependent oxidoreductase n=1 Tax=Microbacterium rhizophilus TaxID=3138934 RepID=UPI0031EE2009
MPGKPAPDVVAGSTVLITGAARGMGELYARRAAREGAAAVALWDVDQDAAAAVAADISAQGVRADAFRVDVSSPDAVRDGVAATRERLGDIDILVNNAGIVRGVPFWEHDVHRDIDLTMRINALAPMWLTREVLPAMMADRSRAKRILNIASAAGTIANPNMSVYASSKWAVIGWSESLRLELARSGHDHLAVTTFCPSYVSTGMFAGARGPLLTPILTPDHAVEAAWTGMIAGRPIVSKPWTVKLGMAARGVLPTRAWDWAADRVFQVYSSMDHFTGRKGA